MKHNSIKFLVLILLIQGVSFAQDKQGVELPQFVITGTQEISFPNVRKLDFDQISSISEEFIKPSFSPDELKIKDISTPDKRDIFRLDTMNYYNGGAKIGFGNNTIPRLSAYYNIPFEDGNVNFDLHGMNQKENVEHANSYLFGGNIGFRYLLGDDVGFLSNNSFSLGGKVNAMGYNYYGSIYPELKNSITDLGFNISLRNIYSKGLNYNISFNSEILKTKIDRRDKYNLTEKDRLDVNENVMSLQVNTKMDWYLFDVVTGLNLITQDINNINFDDKYNYLRLTGGGFFNLTGGMRVGGGISFTNFRSLVYLHPYAYFSMKLINGLIWISEFNPTTEFVSAKDVLSVNNYANINLFKNNMTNRFVSLNSSLMFQVERLVEVTVGGQFSKIDNQMYYTDSLATGFFDINTKSANNLSIFLNFKSAPQNWGFLSGEFKYNYIFDENNDRLPYYPLFRGRLNYGLPIINELFFNLGISYFSNVFIDMKNSKELNSILSLDLSTEYSISESTLLFLQINNILNQEYSYWNNYIEKKFDILAGIKVKF